VHALWSSMSGGSGQAVTIWVDDEGGLRAVVHDYSEAAEEHAEAIEAAGLNVLVVHDFEVEGDGGRD
jgi:hypothetical protein